MVKQKRNANGASEFTGFAAFASHQSSAAAAVQLSRSKGTTTASSSSSEKPENRLKLNPIYAGNDAQLAQIFKRVTKKDATTKSRALSELCSYAFPCDDSGIATKTTLQKNEQVSVLSHFFFLLANKLIHDNNSLVRKESLKVIGNAMEHVPKACNGLLRQDVSADNIGAIGNVIGWTYSFQSSQIAEESKLAMNVWKSMFTMLRKFHDNDVEGYVKQCVVSHAESILQSSSRATNLASALSVSRKKSIQPVQSKKGGKGKVQSNKSDEAGGPSESEKEDMEERYERVVLLTLRALCSLLREYPEKDDNEFRYADIVQANSVLWKHISSLKGSFRRTTFDLVTCIIQNATSLIHGGKSGTEANKSNLSSLLLNILSSERDLANFAPLFEMVLLFIASFRKFDGGIEMAWVTTESEDGCCRGMDVKSFVKSMSKVLKKACYGSPSLQWAPMMLPILATIKSPDYQLQILTSLWNGRTAAVGTADAMAIVSAVTECSMYLLVKNDTNGNIVAEEKDEEGGEHALAMDIAQIFLDCLSYYLTTPSRGSASMDGEKELSSTLIRDICKLGSLPSDRKNCKFARIKTWFWKEGMSTIIEDLNTTSIRRLRSLVDGVAKVGRNGTNSGDDESFRHTIKTILWNTILPSCDPSPSNHHLSLLMSIFKFCTVGFIFDASECIEPPRKSMESFCTDTLVSWISQSEASTNKPSLELVFEMLFMIMTNVGSESGTIKPIWECCLQEMVNKDDSLGMLIIGLTVLVTRYNDLIDTLQCQTFDDYAITIANLSESSHQNNARTSNVDELRAENELSFFRLSAGLEGLASKSLVSSQTIENWLAVALSNNLEYGIYKERHILLELIFSIASNDPAAIDRNTLLKVAVRAWKEGGPTWTCTALKGIVASDEILRSALLSSCSGIINKELKEQINVKGTKVDLDSYHWAERASRALDIYHQYTGDDELPLQFVGFGDIGVWTATMNDNETTKCDSLYLCFMYMMQKYSDDLFKEAESNLRLGLHIFMAFVTFDGVKTKRCENLLAALGEGFKKDIIETYMFALVDLLSREIGKETASELYTRRAVVVLDWFVGLLVPKCVPFEESSTADDDIDQSEIKEGDELWYIPDSTNANSERVRVTVVKVHTDDLPNLYFSIKQRLDSEDIKTKQTVGSRLKKLQYSKGRNKVVPSPLPGTLIPRLEEAMILKLVKPFITGSKEFARGIAAEILNSTVSHCGFQGKSGIGSTRFYAFQILSSMEQELLAMLTGTEVDFSVVGLRLECLATVLGYGTVTVRSQYNCEIFKYNGQSLINAMKEAFGEDNSAMEGSSLCYGLMMWLGASSQVIMSEENASYLWETMETITSLIVGEPLPLKSPLLILEGIDDMKKAMAPIATATKAATLASVQTCVANVCELFMNSDDSFSESHHVGEYFVDDNLISEKWNEPYWFRAFRRFVVKEIQNDSDVLSHLAGSHTEDLMQCLSSPLKQWISFHILHASASKSGMLYADEDVELSDETNDKLDSWLEGLDEEEAKEIEDDTMTSAQWLPQRLMTSLETWREQSLVRNDYHGRDEHAFTTRILEWLLSLEYLDAAGAVDMRNRAHITSYIAKTGAIKEVFDIAMLFSELEKQEQTDLFKCISIDAENESFSLSQLCTLAIFRSIESMPTLCKSWWNDECPRSLQIELNTFVESMVAPETLRREMQRIKNSSALGELEVNGSCVSREVIATYMQDECKLSVVIRVPPSFPLRNAEVDCQKTLGISDKRWRYWSLQIMRMLNNQDGSMLDALLLWKQNVDKEFEGVEPCPVCYSVLCVKTHAMPNLECKTCQNRFHSSCLYKWFNSSGKNQCVLCQQPWSGSKVL